MGARFLWKATAHISRAHSDASLCMLLRLSIQCNADHTAQCALRAEAHFARSAALVRRKHMIFAVFLV